MNEQESIAYIEEWDVTEAAKVLKWYEDYKLLRPCDCDTIVAIETEDLKAENAKLREFVYDMWNDMNVCYTQHEGPDSGDMDFYRDSMRDLGIEAE